MQIVSLLPEERKSLLVLAKQTRDAKTAIRVRVILALDAGYTTSQIAELFLLDEDTVAKWKKRYLKGKFFSDWLGEDYKGYGGKLTRDQQKEVAKFVQANIITDCRQVIGFIRDNFNRAYTVDAVTKLLHKLHFVYKQIAAVPGKLNEENQQEFLAKYETMKSQRGADEVILFGDGVHPTHNIHKTRAWVQKGEEKQVKTNTGRKRLNINGALDPQSLDVTVHFSETINAQTTMEFFDKLQARYSRKKKIKLIVDNATYYKNKDVKAYLDNPTCRIELIFLPTYSPNLNFIERLWKFLKKYIIGVKYRQTFGEFERDVGQFFDNIASYREELRQFIGSRLHLVKLTV